MRAGDGLSVLYGRRFSMHLMIQPVLCGQLFGNSMMTGQGFLSRYLCSYPASTIGWRPYKAQDLSAEAYLKSCETDLCAMLVEKKGHAEKELEKARQRSRSNELYNSAFAEQGILADKCRDSFERYQA